MLFSSPSLWDYCSRPLELFLSCFFLLLFRSKQIYFYYAGISHSKSRNTTARMAPCLVLLRLHCACCQASASTRCTACCFPVILCWHWPGFPPPPSFFFVILFHHLLSRTSDLSLGSATLVLHINCPAWKHQTEPGTLSAFKEEGVIFLRVSSKFIFASVCQVWFIDWSRGYFKHTEYK